MVVGFAVLPSTNLKPSIVTLSAPTKARIPSATAEAGVAVPTPALMVYVPAVVAAILKEV